MESGRPRLSAVTNLIVRVLDVNDNPPEFASKYYFATIREGVDIGTDVVRVMATSRDTGVNADISYSIVGGNEQRKFTIDPLSGLVSVSGQIDYERAKEYFLTIQARDGGNPPLSNQATVNITIMDTNDNSPIFTQVSYTASVREDSPIGASVVLLTATDLDQGYNGRVLYSIVHGDQQSQFSIDNKTGMVSVGKVLDREMISSYVLEVVARDEGRPSLSTSVLVNINIGDTNDNAPLFPEGNYTVYVQEDKPYGHILLRFSVTDADDSPNGAPFTWDIRAGNEESAFRIVQDGSLRTAKKFNHKQRDQYVLQIRVFDNGTPPLYSDTYVTVNIIEESQYPPIITPLDVQIFSYQDDFPGSIVGKIKASDQDTHDVLSYELMPSFSAANLPPSQHLFEIDRRDGTIVALQGLDVGVYNLNVSVSDGKFTSFQSARVSVELVTDRILQHAVIVRFGKITPEEFVDSFKTSFVKILRNLFNVRSKDVEIFGVQLTYGGGEEEKRFPRQTTEEKIIEKQTGRQPGVEVLFAIRQDNSIYFSRDEIRTSLQLKLSSVAAQIGLKILEVRGDFCKKTSCNNGSCRDVILMSDRQIISVSTDVTSLVFPQFTHETVCDCKTGYTGTNCEHILNECHREPCPSFKMCIPDSSAEGYSCQCPPGFTGAMCNVNITSCQDRKCSVVNPLQFSGHSYAQYSIKRSLERHLSLSLGFRTLYKAATLMFAQGVVDYSILEIVSGKLQYRFNFGSGEGVVTLVDLMVSDGEWHEVKLERHGNSAELSVDGKWRTHGAAPGLNDILNLDKADVYFGAEVSQGSASDMINVGRGFVGCMDDIRLDHVAIPLHINGDSTVAKLKRFANIEFKCDALKEPGACGEQPCQNGGTCLELPTRGFVCTCPPRFSGSTCEYDLDPCSSSPCLHGAKCVNLKNDYHCECPAKLSGKRCHYGQYCNPNPCQNNGICEEGSNGPICKCRGFTGEHCTIDVNECLHQNPCHNGGTCINSPGGFTCICPGNTTGLYCNDLAHLSMLPRKFALSLEEVVGIICSLFIIVLLVALFVVCRKLGTKRGGQERNQERNLILPNEFDKEHIMMKPRNGAVHHVRGEQDMPLLSGQHPSTISGSHQKETHFNYTDTIRHYGAAAEELETLPRIPHDYLHNVHKPVATVAPSMMADRDMHLTDNYFKNSRPSSLSSGYFRPHKLAVNLPPEMTEPELTELSVEDDGQRYHWDCSDWVSHAHAQTMPEHATTWETPTPATTAVNQATDIVDPTRDIETLPEDDKETPDDGNDDARSIASSGAESQLGAVYPQEVASPVFSPDVRSPMHQTNKSIEELLMVNDMNYADADDNNSGDIPNIYDYKLHLNNYLPTYHLGSDPETTTDEATPMLGRHTRPYLTPAATSSPGPRSPEMRHSQDPEAAARKPSSGPLRGLILPPVVTSNGQSTDKLCEIEDEDDEVTGIQRTPSPRITQV